MNKRSSFMPSLLSVLFSFTLSACAGSQPPLALQPIDPSLDESGTMPSLALVNAGQPVNLLQAIVKQGVPLKLAKTALLKYDSFSNSVSNTNYLVMIDFTQHSSKNRLYMIHKASGKVDAIPTAHGAGSDPGDTGFAQYFSNVPDSHMSSLGSYLIQEVYRGKYGDSMRLDGLERSNSNVRFRSIVLHPSTYVKEGTRKQGRSWGCPAIPYAWIKKALERLARGAFMYVHGKNLRDTSTDEFFIRQWDLIPKSQWTDESEDAPLDGV